MSPKTGGRLTGLQSVNYSYRRDFSLNCLHKTSWYEARRVKLGQCKARPFNFHRVCFLFLVSLSAPTHDAFSMGCLSPKFACRVAAGPPPPKKITIPALAHILPAKCLLYTVYLTPSFRLRVKMNHTICKPILFLIVIFTTKWQIHLKQFIF